MGWPGPLTHRQYMVWIEWLRQEAERLSSQYGSAARSRRKPKTLQEADLWAKMKWLPAVGYEPPGNGDEPSRS